MIDALAAQQHDLPLLITPEQVSGGIYIVTGANTGLGFEAAKHLVTLGASRVILGVRNTTTGEAAKAKIEAASGTSNVAHVWALDLASHASVKAFAKRAVTELDRIDALIENAGVAANERVMAEGHLMDVTVNVLSTLLLGVLLLPKMKEGAKRFGILPHLVVVSSSYSFGSEAQWNRIKDDPLNGMDAEDMPVSDTYALSKLLQIKALRELAPLTPPSRTGVVLNYLCPGFCTTALIRNAAPARRAFFTDLHHRYGRSAEDGSRTLLHAAAAGLESHGRFLQSCRVDDAALPGWITDAEGLRSQKTLWEAVRRELEAIEPGCVEAVLVG